MQCGVCGGTSFAGRAVLWPRLIDEWQLSPEEVRYVDRQQAECCTECGANLRSVALANALRAHLGTPMFMREIAKSPIGSSLALLEINEAGHLSPLLRMFGNYVFGSYPQVDIHALPYADGTFDIVIHSDTLEHVKNPIHALQECRRVLKPGGAVCFTVPTIVKRLSRSREGLAKSFHGDAATASDDYAVQTEFGADAWTFVMEAGFDQVSIHAVGYPAGIAYTAKRAPA